MAGPLLVTTRLSAGKPSRLKRPAEFEESNRPHDAYVSWLIEQYPRWRAQIRRWRLKDSAVDEDDLAQQLALAALELKPRLETRVATERSAYLMTIGRHLAQRRMRFQRGAVSLDDMPEVADPKSAKDESSDNGRMDQLMDRTLAAVGELSKLQRGALHARYVLGLKSPEAAPFLRSTPLAVRNALSRGIQRLRAINGRGPMSRSPGVIRNFL